MLCEKRDYARINRDSKFTIVLRYVSSNGATFRALSPKRINASKILEFHTLRRTQSSTSVGTL